MVSKKVFKEEISKLLVIHNMLKEVPEEMLIEWHKECEPLNEEDFIKSVKRCYYCNRMPKLYDILINLPSYNKDLDKTIADYCKRVYSTKKGKCSYDIDKLIEKMKQEVLEGK